MRFSFSFFILISLLYSYFDPELLKALKSYIPILLGLVMFGMGMTIEFNKIKEIVLNPKWLFTGLILQFSVMPFLAFILSKSFNLSNELLIGFVILGSCPGGTASNVIAYLSKANLPLSISLTLFSTFFSILITPFWIYYYANEMIEIQTLSLIKTTFWIVVFPVLDGLILRRLLKSKIDPILKFFPKLSEIFIALIIGIIFSLSSDLFDKITTTFIIVIILHNFLGLVIGYFTASFFKFPIDVRKTIAIEVGMQNSGLGMTLSLIHFGKVVALPSAIFSLWHNLSAIFLISFWSKKKKHYCRD